MDVDALLDESLPDAELARTVRDEGMKPAADGLESDDGKGGAATQTVTITGTGFKPSNRGHASGKGASRSIASSVFIRSGS